VATAKYADHLPLHRLEGIFSRYGVELARSTMCDWIRDVADLLAPIVSAMKARVLATGYVQTDDTPLQVQMGHGKTHRGYVWAYRSPEIREVVYDFTLSRARDGPEKFLKRFRGYLQADAYSGYDRIVMREGVTEVGCWAHARRKFFESLCTDAERASAVVAAIRRLYRIEAEAKEAGITGERLAELRRSRAAPILDDMEAYLELIRPEVLPKSPLGKAITYAQNQWRALRRYVEDGRLEMDNNGAERSMRRVAIGRKNYLFAGSPAGGHRAAVLYSLTESCRLQGIDPQAYLKDVLSRVKTHPANRVDELTPSGWKQAREESERSASPVA
jgi:hypothetical protein